MPSKLVKIKGTDVMFEVDYPDGQPQMMSARNASAIDDKLDNAFKLVKYIADPFVNTWHEISKDSVVDGAEVEIALGLTAEGNLFIAKSKVSTSIKVKLKINSAT